MLWRQWRLRSGREGSFTLFSENLDKADHGRYGCADGVDLIRINRNTRESGKDGESAKGGGFFEAGKDVIHSGSLWWVLSAHDCIEGCETNRTADDKRNDSQPRLDLGEHTHRQPSRRSDKAGERGGGLVVVHG